MIKIKVELWPGGRPAGMKELGEMTITNIAQSMDDIYQYDIVLRDYASREVVHDSVMHHRDKSVWILLLEALDSLYQTKHLPEKAKFPKK